MASVQVTSGGQVKLDNATGNVMLVGAEDCALPSSGICPHSLCFEISVTADELAGTIISGDFVDLIPVGGGSPVLGMFIQYNTGEWQLYNDFDTVSVFQSVTADAWYAVEIRTWASAPGTSRMQLVVNGQESTVGDGPPGAWDEFRAGCFLHGPVNKHSIRNIRLRANPNSSENSFFFPPDNFDSTVGSGITVGGGVITINSPHADAYARKFLDPAYDACKDCSGCPSPSDTVTVEISGTVGCDCVEIPPGFSNAGGSLSTGGTADGTYVLSYTGDLNGPIFEFTGPLASPIVHSASWNSPNNNCTGPPDNESDSSANCYVLFHCNTLDGLRTVFLSLGGGSPPYATAGFQALVDCLGNGQPVDNQNVCVIETAGGLNLLMFGGTATVTW